MINKRRLKFSIAIMALVFFAGLGLFLYELSKVMPSEIAPERAYNPSGDFTLTTVDGKDFHLSDLRGKIVLLFFGYTTCPDACPIALAKIHRTMSLLGPDKNNVETVFVTVDPDRDTPEKLKEYLNYFGINTVGLVGTKEQIDSVVHAYRAYYQKSTSQSALGYTMIHTTTIFLIDKRGKVRHLFDQIDNARTMADTIKKFL